MLGGFRFGGWIVQPIVTGVENGEPVLASYDSIGAQCMIERFEVAGTGSEELVAICEAYYREGMEKDELAHKLHQIITAASDRDMYSGWGAVVYIVSKDGVSTTFHQTKQS